MKLNILKCHGSANDFILIDEVAGNNETIAECDRSQLSRLLCDRNTGIGADGVLFYLAADSADCLMRMFNPDGSEAEMCGNGLRCVGRYCCEQLLKNTVTVATKKAVLSVTRGNSIYPGIETFEAEIGPVGLNPSTLPMFIQTDGFVNEHLPEISSHLRFTALSVPNPHIVAVVDEIDEKLLNHAGVVANHSPTFPKGVNVSFVRNLGQNRIYVVTYERGVGITYSCGTAMSASAYVSCMNGITQPGEPICVFNNGGMVVCDVPSFGANSHIILKGNATFVFEAVVTVSDDGQSIVGREDKALRDDEIRSYERLQDYAKSVISRIDVISTLA